MSSCHHVIFSSSHLVILSSCPLVICMSVGYLEYLSACLFVSLSTCELVNLLACELVSLLAFQLAHLGACELVFHYGIYKQVVNFFLSFAMIKLLAKLNTSITLLNNTSQQIVPTKAKTCGKVIFYVIDILYS